MVDHPCTIHGHRWNLQWPPTNWIHWWPGLDHPWPWMECHGVSVREYVTFKICYNFPALKNKNKSGSFLLPPPNFFGKLLNISMGDCSLDARPPTTQLSNNTSYYEWVDFLRFYVSHEYKTDFTLIYKPLHATIHSANCTLLYTRFTPWHTHKPGQQIQLQYVQLNL